MDEWRGWIPLRSTAHTHTCLFLFATALDHSIADDTDSASRQNVRTSLISQYLGRFNSLRADEVDPLLAVAHCLGTWEGVVHNLELGASAMQCGAPRETLLN